MPHQPFPHYLFPHFIAELILSDLIPEELLLAHRYISISYPLAFFGFHTWNIISPLALSSLDT